MKVASVANVKARFSEFVKASSESPVVITRNGKAVAAIIPLNEDQDLEQLMLDHSPRLRAILDEARGRRGKAIPHKQFWEAMEASPPQKAVRRKPR